MSAATFARYPRSFLFGKPDGTFIRLRCIVLGHRWRECHDWCCKGGCWCTRCALPEFALHTEAARTSAADSQTIVSRSVPVEKEKP